MFTGIIEEVGKVKSVVQKGKARVFAISSEKLLNDIKIGDSVAVNGVCLTVFEKLNEYFKVEAVEETIKKTNLGNLKTGDRVNLELSLKLGDRLGGHIVLGHVDTTGVIENILKLKNSWIFEIKFPSEFRKYIIPKGSIAVDGISLTIAEVDDGKFKVSIIPFTWENTNLKFKRSGDRVNLEFDFFGKYIESFLKQWREQPWQGG
ncbi:riboflavin synthase [Candidatus Kryptobacter tengchongensis]|uniref:Riboflavin synthase n=1 Tax=Kryptobacter tengchongensis TaxID=1643429 RepID=A0A656D9M5_KRYT1|nr:riboflavin synthase [Candidatus Kryptobacter tengchongensis]CUT03391.1 riboflavin synthase alpha chain [Candidatus Kryptobacter tengchongensis]CUT04134.1 riboflavin synthase alpha chain [Candidatus Kryptobacter tengchongensis]